MDACDGGRTTGGGWMRDRMMGGKWMHVMGVGRRVGGGCM